MTIALIRYAVLVVPLGALGLAWALTPRPDRRTAGALLLAFLAAFTGVGAVNQVALAVGWWRYAALDGSFLGVPVDLWLGWAVLWGPVPLLLRRVPLPVVVLGLGWVDLLAMPRLAPVVELGGQWLLGELLGLLAVVVPVQLLGRWTIARTRLAARATLQLVTFTGLVVWLVPSATFTAGGAWRHVWTGPTAVTSVLLQLMALAAALGVAGVVEFVARGDGTPYPWDPPDRLVGTGPYAYLANPMQTSAVLLLGLLAVAAHSWPLGIAALVAVVFSAVLADPHERRDLARRLGPGWQAYDAAVRPWRIRRTPYLLEPPARLYLARTCELCDQTRALVAARSPSGLELVPAETVGGLRRARYVGPDGLEANGLAAVARALDHCGPGWAYAGSLLRLPVLRVALQALVDLMGGGPRDLRPTARTET